jgi:hypothetical protein
MDSPTPHLKWSLGPPQFGPASHLLRYVSPFEGDLPGFFLQLDPYHWRVNFEGAHVGQQEGAFEFFKAWLEEHSPLILRDLNRARELGGADIHAFLSEWSWKFIEAAAAQVGQPVGEPEAVNFALAGATGVLNKGLELGDDQSPHWSLSGKKNGKVRLHFQDALDLGAIYDLKEAVMRRDRGMSDPAEVPVKGIYSPLPNILNRDGLVREDNFVTFLAEYIVAVKGGKSFDAVPPSQPASGLRYAFLPLRGLMQWRAAVDWISVAATTPRVSKVSQDEGMVYSERYAEKLVYAIRTSIEGFYSHSLIKAFVRGLFEILFISETETWSDKDFSAPFALLWWAHDIVFFKDGVRQHTLTRDASGFLRPLPGAAANDIAAWALPRAPQSDREFCVVEELDAGGAADRPPVPCHSVRLNLLNSGAPDERLSAFTQICGFDEVVYRVFLLSFDSVHRDELFWLFVNHLRDEIYEAAKEFQRVLDHLALVRKLEREETSIAAAYELGHTLSHWAVATQNVLQELDEFIGPEEGRQHLRIANRGLIRIGSLGNVLDVNTRAIRRNVTAEAFLGKKEWYSFAEYNVWKNLNILAAEVWEGQSREGEPKRPVVAALSPILGRARVGTWITSPLIDNPVRPSDIFYDHVLFEVLNNAAAHGRLEPESSVVVVEVSLEDHLERKALVFRNAAGINEVGKLSAGIRGFEYGRWFSWRESRPVSVGGLSYVEGVMRRTGTGRVFVRVDPEHVWFKLEIVGLTLATEA